MGTFLARFPGQCGNCGRRVFAGEVLAYDEGEVVHVECVGEGPAPVQKEVCGKCWMLKPCDCADD